MILRSAVNIGAILMAIRVCRSVALPNLLNFGLLMNDVARIINDGFLGLWSPLDTNFLSDHLIDDGAASLGIGSAV